MIKLFLILVLSLLSIRKANGQDSNRDSYRDSLRQQLATVREDTSKVKLHYDIGWSFVFFDEDSAAHFAKKGLDVAREINYKHGEAKCLWLLAFSLSLLGNFPGALDFGLKELTLAESLKDTALLTEANFVLMTCYWSQGDFKTALDYAHRTELFSRSPKADATTRSRLFGMMGATYLQTNQLDSALYYGLESFELCKKTNLVWSGIYLHLGNIYSKKGLTDLALEYYRKGIPIAEETHLYIDLVSIYIELSKVFESTGLMDSAFYYAQKSLRQKGIHSFPDGALRAVTQLAHLYDLDGNRDSTIKYLKLSIDLREKLFSREKTREANSLAFNEQLHKQELAQKTEQDELKYRNRMKTYILSAGLAVLLLVAVGLWRRNVFRQKSFTLLQKQKEETENQKSKVERTLEELRITQSQLIQSEKMASLGELTAGIAHEIQNPLNFVNNFSGVNEELLTEMKDELTKGKIENALALATDAIENQKKINHHGNRADAIVKGMLQHSRSNSGQKEPTDINALLDEYLRLAYHGLRAKDNSFNATMKTDFDESIGNINIIPQEMGRVILNLLHNAFYTVREKKKQGGEGYEPTVSVSSKKINRIAEIRVKDNGDGIPQKILDKIFQPFFTTKPTGQGTGLGLSLAYDIVKAHGGVLEVKTREGEGSEFIIQLPVV